MAMFGQAVSSYSHHERSGGARGLSEFVATLGLIAIIRGCARHRETVVAPVVAAYIAAAYWSFANPAVTLGRALTDSNSGIRPSDVPGFIVAQAVGALRLRYSSAGWPHPRQPRKTGSPPTRTAIDVMFRALSDRTPTASCRSSRATSSVPGGSAVLPDQVGFSPLPPAPSPRGGPAPKGLWKAPDLWTTVF